MDDLKITISCKEYRELIKAATQVEMLQNAFSQSQYASVFEAHAAVILGIDRVKKDD